MEILRGLRRLGVHPALCTRYEKPAIRASLLWHLVCMVAESPLDWLESTTKLVEAARAQPLLAGSHVGTPGQGLAFFPFWPEAHRLLHAKNGANVPSLWPGSRSDARSATGGASAEAPTSGRTPAAPPARPPSAPVTGTVDAGRNGLPSSQSASVLHQAGPQQYASRSSQPTEHSLPLNAAPVAPGPFAREAAQGPPGALPGLQQHALSPGSGGGTLPDSSPGGFWDVMNSELVTGPSDLLPASFPTGGSGNAPAVPFPSVPPPAGTPYAVAASPPLFDSAHLPLSGGASASGGQERMAQYGTPQYGPQYAAVPTPPLQAQPEPALSPSQYRQAQYQQISSSQPYTGYSRPYSAPSPPTMPGAVDMTVQIAPQAPPPAQQQESRAVPVRIWTGPLQLSDRVRGTAPALLGLVDAYVAAEHAQRASLAVQALVVESFLLGPGEARKLAAAAARPGALVLRLMPKEFQPHGEQALRRMAAGYATGQLDLGRGMIGFLSVKLKASSEGGPVRPVLRLVATPR